MKNFWMVVAWMDGRYFGMEKFNENVSFFDVKSFCFNAMNGGFSKIVVYFPNSDKTWTIDKNNYVKIRL